MRPRRPGPGALPRRPPVRRHDSANGFTGFNGFTDGTDGVARGSVAGRVGTRNPPSPTYLRHVPPLYFYQDDDAAVPSPFGGLMLDGRVDTLARQVREPLLARHEMNLGTPARLAEHLKAAGYREPLEARFGSGVLADPARAVDAVGKSLEAYLRSDELAPFDSRFDDLLRGKPVLLPLELRGLALFRDPDRGNCASCHSVSVTSSNPPARFSPTSALTRPAFDDLPPALRGNVNVVSTPLNRKPGSEPALSEADIDAVVAFLGTLPDRRYLAKPPR